MKISGSDRTEVIKQGRFCFLTYLKVSTVNAFCFKKSIKLSSVIRRMSTFHKSEANGRGNKLGNFFKVNIQFNE